MSTIAQIMTKSPKSVGLKSSVAAVAKAMRQARVGSLLVRRGTAFVGIVTDTDVVRRAVASGKPLGKLTVDKIMTTPVCTIEGNESVDEAQDMMAELGVRHLGVTKGGAVVGIISVRDLLVHYKRRAHTKIAEEVTYEEPKITQD